MSQWIAQSQLDIGSELGNDGETIAPQAPPSPVPPPRPPKKVQSASSFTAASDDIDPWAPPLPPKRAVSNDVLVNPIPLPPKTFREVPPIPVPRRAPPPVPVYEPTDES